MFIRAVIGLEAHIDDCELEFLEDFIFIESLELIEACVVLGEYYLLGSGLGSGKGAAM